jgi:hypothetical protein
MMSSKSPGRLGVYGFRNRADYSYDRYSIANSLAIKEDRLWDILSRNGKRSEDISHPADRGTKRSGNPEAELAITCDSVMNLSGITKINAAKVGVFYG